MSSHNAQYKSEPVIEVVKPKFGHAFISQEPATHATNPLDKLSGSSTGIFASIVQTATQAGGAAFNAAVHAASALASTVSDVAESAPVADALAQAKVLGHDAAVLARDTTSTVAPMAINSLSAAKDSALETLDSAKNIAVEKASNLSVAAQAKAADIVSAVQEKAADLSSAVQEQLAPRTALPFTDELRSRVESGTWRSSYTPYARRPALRIKDELHTRAVNGKRVPYVRRPALPIKDELILKTSSGSWTKHDLGFDHSQSLPFTDELLQKRSPAEEISPSTSVVTAAAPISSSLPMFTPTPCPVVQVAKAEDYSAPISSDNTESRSVPKSEGDQLFAQEKVEKDLSSLNLTMDVVAHLQRIADRTGDALLHETARKAHSAFARGLNEAPGVHLTNVNSQQANELLNLAIQTQNRELADFARYCQSVADTTQIAVEPTPGKIMQEIEKGRQELQSQGRVHTGPGYGAAFASIDNKSKRLSTGTSNTLQADKSGEQLFNGKLELSMDVVAHVQRIADRTGDALLHETARRAHSACAKGLQEAPGVHLTSVTPQQANELLNLAIQTQDRELADFARYCQSVAATTQIAVEPTPGKIMQEIEKGRQELQSQGRVHTGPGYGAAFASVTSNAQGQRVSNRKSGSFEKSASRENIALVAPPAVGQSQQ